MALPNDTPSLAQVLKDAIEGRLSEVNTTMPATIESYDDETGFADVSPCIQRIYDGETAPVDRPVIKNVPVVFPRGGGALIKFDLQEGDEVVLHFSQRSLDRWKTTGGKVDPQDTRKFHISDCFATPGGTSMANPPAAATVTMAFTGLGVSISNAIGNFTFKDNGDVSFDTGTVQGLFGSGGKVKFQNAGGELLATLSKLIGDITQLMTDIQSATTVTMLGPEPLVMPTFATDLTTLATDKALLDTFKA